MLLVSCGSCSVLSDVCSGGVFQELEADGQEASDWEKYAAEEYDILVAEEAANDQCNDV